MRQRALQADTSVVNWLFVHGLSGGKPPGLSSLFQNLVLLVQLDELEGGTSSVPLLFGESVVL
jgi:hypothetical protein